MRSVTYMFPEISLYFVYVLLSSILLLWIYLSILSIKSFFKIKSLKSVSSLHIKKNKSKMLFPNNIVSKLTGNLSLSIDYYNNIDSENNNYSSGSISLPFVSVIVPARNEEREIERCLVSILNQKYPLFEVIAIDDSSSDSTFEKMRKIKDKMPQFTQKLTILSNKDYDHKPDDWCGKTWVSEKAFEKSKGDVILFTDADSYYSDTHTISTTVSYMIKEKLDVLGGLPYLRLQDLLSKIVMPLWNLLSILLSDAGKVNDPNRIDIAFILGSFFLIKRDVFRKIGTYHVVKDAVQEDFDLALILKKNGFKLRLVKIDSLVSALWSRDALTLWQGIGRTIVPVAVRNIKKVLYGLFNILYMALLPFFICAVLIYGEIVIKWDVPYGLLYYSIFSCLVVIFGVYIKGFVQYKEKNPWYAFLSIFGSMFLTITYLINIVPLLIKKRKIVKWRSRSYEFKQIIR
jgi:chlorobactene glucosyltransferase